MLPAELRPRSPHLCCCSCSPAHLLSLVPTLRRPAVDCRYLPVMVPLAGRRCDRGYTMCVPIKGWHYHGDHQGWHYHGGRSLRSAQAAGADGGAAAGTASVAGGGAAAGTAGTASSTDGTAGAASTASAEHWQRRVPATPRFFPCPYGKAWNGRQGRAGACVNKRVVGCR